MLSARRRRIPGPIDDNAVNPAFLVNTLSTSFDGVDEQVQRGNTTSFAFERTDTFSFSFWIKTIVSAESVIFSKRGSTASTPGYMAFINSATGRVDMLLEGTGGDAVHVETDSTDIGFIPVAGDAWRNVVVTYAGTSLASGVLIYVDGSLQVKVVNQDDLASSILAGTREFKFGVKGTSSSDYRGNMDEISVWNAVLSSADVTAIYNNGKPTTLLVHPAQANLLSWWRCGDGDTVPTWTDNKGSDDMTMTNMDLSNFQTDTP